MAKKKEPEKDPEGFGEKDVESSKPEESPPKPGEPTSEQPNPEGPKEEPDDTANRLSDRKKFVEDVMNREKEGKPLPTHAVRVSDDCKALLANKNFVVEGKIFAKGEAVAAMSKGASLDKLKSDDCVSSNLTFNGINVAIKAGHVDLA